MVWESRPVFPNGGNLLKAPKRLEEKKEKKKKKREGKKKGKGSRRYIISLKVIESWGQLRVTEAKIKILQRLFPPPIGPSNSSKIHFPCHFSSMTCSSSPLNCSCTAFGRILPL